MCKTLTRMTIAINFIDQLLNASKISSLLWVPSLSNTRPTIGNLLKTTYWTYIDLPCVFWNYTSIHVGGFPQQKMWIDILPFAFKQINGIILSKKIKILTRRLPYTEAPSILSKHFTKTDCHQALIIHHLIQL